MKNPVKSATLKKMMPRIRRHTKPGTAPGTVQVLQDAQQTQITVIQYNGDTIEEFVITHVEQLARLHLQEECITWVQVVGLGNASMINAIGAQFKLHRLALEDVVNAFQRVKMEDYGDYMFCVLRHLSRHETLASDQFNVFWGKNFVLTFSDHRIEVLDRVAERLRHSLGRIRSAGADYLAYSVIDALIDGYFPLVDFYAEQIERVDQIVSEQFSPRIISEMHAIRHDIMVLNRFIRPLKDSLIRLMTETHMLVSSETRYYFRDCYDHVLQLNDLLDAYREITTDQREFYLSSINVRMNDVMKILTIISTIFIPLSFIASVYGMNFDHSLPLNMPELRSPYGYPIIMGLMASVAGALLWFFWRKGWLNDSLNGSLAPKHEKIKK